ncbi:hypothetical protein [Pseudomonas sp. PSKL.D1]|uniref:hypothetical protein n=1 Tax=Pseudomonas sp. PSKL.D1 TaxID=3029060 RepID=UPI002380D33D|nr:hypothetical protein [Pseudomonas sp. PSKL.D1]WDY60023.1 hypothetical protein PVV54_10510 [Pseudomonas sp. PSKL.D1]
MTMHNFQLAYTITPRTAEDEDAAAKARLYMRDIGWSTIHHIETTLLGEIPLFHTRMAERISEAEQEIRGQVHKLFKELQVLTRVRFHGSLMVDGLGPAINFSIVP